MCVCVCVCVPLEHQWFTRMRHEGIHEETWSSRLYVGLYRSATFVVSQIHKLQLTLQHIKLNAQLTAYVM